MTNPFVLDSSGTIVPHSWATPQATPRLAPVSPASPRPFWSVIVTLYNRTLFLPQCLASILDQNIPPQDLQLFIADNSDGIDMTDLINTHAHGRAQHLQISTRGGLYPNLNQALPHTRGTWIHILHDDDFVLPGFYNTMRAALEPQPESVGMANCQYSNIRADGTPPWSSTPYREGPGLQPNWPRQVLTGNPLNFAAVVHRRTTFETLGIFREDLPYAADWEIYLRSAVACDWWSQPENLARFRLHQGNLSWLYAANGQAPTDIRHVYEVAETYLPAELKREILPASRYHHGQTFIAEAAHILARGNIPLAVHYLKEAALISPALASIPDMQRLLALPELQPFRTQISNPSAPS